MELLHIRSLRGGKSIPDVGGVRSTTSEYKERVKKKRGTRVDWMGRFPNYIHQGIVLLLWEKVAPALLQKVRSPLLSSSSCIRPGGRGWAEVSLPVLGFSNCILYIKVDVYARAILPCTLWQTFLQQGGGNPIYISHTLFSFNPRAKTFSVVQRTLPCGTRAKIHYCNVQVHCYVLDDVKDEENWIVWERGA